MKKMIFSVFTLMLMTAAANAQNVEVKNAPPATNVPATQAAPAPQATPAAQAATQSTAPQATAARQDNGKVKVEVKDLPAAVQAAIASDEYKGWTATTAWHVKGTPEHYAIEMRKGEETTTVKLDKDGKKVG